MVAYMSEPFPDLNLSNESSPARPAPEKAVTFLCECGNTVVAGPDENPIRCACGRTVADLVDGVVTVPSTTGYWGEISKEDMDRLILRSRQSGWRAAVSELPEDMQDNIMSPERAAFEDVLPLPEGSRVLDIGAGLGAVATQLAKRYRVTALEGVQERARFIALRKQQDKLDTLTIINSNFAEMPLAPAQYDCITVIGVLEWAPLFDPALTPEAAQEKFMRTLRNLLAPGGMICLGIENRWGWAQMSGVPDHSGLPYTSLMPRWMARWVCNRNEQFRSSFNTGYRTYTYGYNGFRDLFSRAGLGIESFWIAPTSYHRPVAMVPMDRSAIGSYVQQNWLRPAVNTKSVIKNWIKWQTATPWFWRTFGSDYIFLLKALSSGPSHS